MKSIFKNFHLKLRRAVILVDHIFSFAYKSITSGKGANIHYIQDFLAGSECLKTKRDMKLCTYAEMLSFRVYNKVYLLSIHFNETRQSPYQEAVNIPQPPFLSK